MNVELWANVGHDERFSLSTPENTLELIVSPIPHIPGDKSVMLSLKNEYMPQKHTSIDRSVDREKTLGLNLNIGRDQGANASYITKNNKSIKSTTDDWRMKYTHCPIEGVKWSYCYVGQELGKAFENQQTLLPKRNNFGDRYFENSVKGFSVTIKQVLNCKIYKPPFNFFNKSSIMKCPKMVHTLEITFNDLEKFNEGFADLRKKIYRGLGVLELELGNKNLDPNILENEYNNN
ncbi:hypothetical protein Glove_86g135 [Diversispora epigaea]|uniref:Uncharacterized protein n=1 Tax=Diversispora epigaea TaxID=1348612 RepID=A0A397J7C4_9GLOM|nr:hypothetical protein Glove_86g135 [Diversispora epigaea]